MIPQVSVIVPVYNVEKYLSRCLDSLLEQTLKDIEIICIDDCSVDNSYNILKSYQNKDARITVIRQEKNLGPGVARNTALDIAHGKYVMFLDPDDWYEEYACETAYNQIFNNKNDIVFFSYTKYFEETGISVTDNSRIAVFKDCINNPNIELSKLKNSFMSSSFAWAQIYSREFLNENNIRFSENYLCEDIVFYVKSLACAKTVSAINMPLYNYFIRSTSLCNSLDFRWKELIYAREKTLEILQQIDKNEIFTYQYLILTINSLLGWKRRIENEYPKLQKVFYTSLREFFIFINKKYDVNKISKYIKIKKYKRIINQNSNIYMLFRILNNIFSLRNSDDNVYKIVTIIGLKIKFSKK